MDDTPIIMHTNLKDNSLVSATSRACINNVRGLEIQERLKILYLSSFVYKNSVEMECNQLKSNTGSTLVSLTKTIRKIHIKIIMSDTDENYPKATNDR